MKDWVCLVEPETLAGLQSAQRAKPGSSYLLQDCVWRQIEITATVDKVTLRRMDVDEEAAGGGYWRCGHACVSHTFAWEDLQDNEFIEGLLVHEQVVVYRRALSMLVSLKLRVVSLREALAQL